MRVDYQLTAEDLFAFQWRAAYRSATARKVRRNSNLVFFAAFLLVAVTPTLGSGGFSPPLISWILLGIVYPIFAGLFWVIERWLSRGTILSLVGKERPEGGQLGRHAVELTAEGVIESTAVGESRTTWSGVHRVEKDDDYLYVYVAASSAHVIPRRAFASGEDEKFYELARSRAEATGTSRHVS
jgi:hypothetical protein